MKGKYLFFVCFAAAALTAGSCGEMSERESAEETDVLERVTDLAESEEESLEEKEKSIQESVYAIFVEVYAHYSAGGSPNQEEFMAYWSEGLRKVYEETEFVDYDVWLDAQDWDEPMYEGVDILSVKGDTARVYVRMVNFGNRRVIPCTLVRENGRWVIDDISRLRERSSEMRLGDYPTQI